MPNKGEMLKLDYAVHLWQEKQIKSVANVTRRDVREFLALAAEIPIRPEIQEYSPGGCQLRAGGAEGTQDPGSQSAADRLSPAGCLILY